MEPITGLDCEHRLCLPSHGLLVGPTMAGKTRLALELLGRPQCFRPPPSHVYCYYSEYQPSYDQLKAKLDAQGVQLHLRQGSNLTLEDIPENNDGQQSIYFIDDATEETASSREIAKITTNARHRGASLWLAWHSLYSKHPASRIISQNCSYYFFLPGPRLVTQLKTLDTQLGYRGKLLDAFKMATEDKDTDHRYLLVNLSPHCDPRLRLRSRIHHEEVQYVYLV